ncbi:MAG: hypothetical protein GXO74_16355 [Calditrichaeota bacterium]|nr:hypothetical protein [Calditrichota bacterium]
MKKQTLLKILALFLWAGLFFCSKEPPEPIVAKAGKTTLPYSEFRDRYEMTPHILLTKDKQRNKERVLMSLLSEKVLVEEAKKRKMDRDEKYRTFAEQMKKEATVEKLFDEEIASKIEVNEDEIKKGFIRSQSKLSLQVLTFDDAKRAQLAKAMIDSGKAFTEVKQALATDMFISADSVLTLEMEWGQSHPKLEDVAYSLKPFQVSEPVFVDGKYFILKLVDRKTNILLTESGYYNKKPSIRKTILERKRTEKFNEFMRELMNKKTVRVSHEIFNLVAAGLEKAYGIQDSMQQKKPKQRDITPAALRQSELADHLKDTFARFNDGSAWTVEEFIKKLSVGPYHVDFSSREKFRRSLRHAVKRMTEFETMAKKGENLGLDKTYYVKYQTKMWSDAFLARRLRNMIVDTVSISNEEIKSYYEKHKNKYKQPALINLHEILVDSKSLADKIYRQILRGADMKKLARKYNKRQISIKSAGITGYFTPKAFGKVGEAAMKLNIGDISKPVKTEKGQYSVFKVLDKKQAGPAPLQSVRNDVRGDALTEKRWAAVDNYLANLGKKYPLKINTSVLDTLTTYDLNMLVLKRHYANRSVAPFVTPMLQTPNWQRITENLIKKTRNKAK